ncbi:hypothetical protein JTB14_016125 [Gonioctena quinquepunctata]|nr:hypothetical protein JTB14_016125 [Gonioctena quinquepunctata]
MQRPKELPPPEPDMPTLTTAKQTIQHKLAVRGLLTLINIAELRDTSGSAWSCQLRVDDGFSEPVWTNSPSARMLLGDLLSPGKGSTSIHRTSELQYMLAHKDNPKDLKGEHRPLLEDIQSRDILHPRHAYA